MANPSLLFLFGILTIMSFVAQGCKGQKVAIYAGTGAALAKDVELALNKLKIPYQRINEDDIKSHKLKTYSTLIIPGGYTQEYVKALAGDGFKNINEFVRNGGTYIGICAGAYIAASTVEVPGHPPGMGIIDIHNKRKSGMRVRNIEITNPKHPIAHDCPKKMNIWYQNGPMISPGNNVDVIAVYENNMAAIVVSSYGKGKVVIFSPHPEGSVEGKADPEKLGTLKLLKNTFAFTVKK
jgi:glutamine amidotransferase-like uncharacterized protein